MRFTPAESRSRSCEITRTVFLVRRSCSSSSRLGRDVEEVVGLVQQQDVRFGAQQDVEQQALALAAAERDRGPLGKLGKAPPDDPPAGGIPLPLELIAAQLRPFPDRLPKLHAGLLGTRGERLLGTVHPLADLAHRARRQLEQQFTDASAGRR